MSARRTALCACCSRMLNPTMVDVALEEEDPGPRSLAVVMRLEPLTDETCATEVTLTLEGSTLVVSAMLVMNKSDTTLLKS
eukprot:761837-Hanusia_phi.AAC.10